MHTKCLKEKAKAFSFLAHDSHYFGVGVKSNKYRYCSQVRNSYILRIPRKEFTETMVKDGKTWNDYVTDIDYKGYRINVAKYGEQWEYV